MDEQLQQALASLINKSVSGFEDSIGWVQGEIPEIIHQLLLWKLTSNIIMFLLCSILFAFFVIKLVPVTKKVIEYQRGSSMYYKNHGDLEKQGREIMSSNEQYLPWFFFYLFCTVVSTLAMLIDGVRHGLVTLQILMTPKIYLIEYAASLTK